MDETDSVTGHGRRTSSAELRGTSGRDCSSKIDDQQRSLTLHTPSVKNGRSLLPPLPAACQKPSSSCCMAVTQPPFSPLPSEDAEWDGDWTSWCIQPATAGGCVPWVGAEPLSPIQSPPGGLSLDGSISASSSSCGALLNSNGGRFGVAGYFSAWLKGECPVLSAVEEEPMFGAPLMPLDARMPGSPASAALAQAGHLSASAQPEPHAPASLPLSPPLLPQPPKPPAITALDALPTGDAASSLSSPVGSDCRTTPDECSSYESGRSCSMSLLSWDAQSSSSSSNGGVAGGDLEPYNEDPFCWAAAEQAALAVAEAGPAEAALECAALRIVECDVWERELDAKLSAEAMSRGSGGSALPVATSADGALEVPCDLAQLVRAVVTEALFDPYPDVCDGCGVY